jgi:DNA-binding LytR/AlgR family response regulator
VEEKLRERINRLLKSVSSVDVSYRKLPIKERGRIILINQSDILYAESQGKKVFVYTADNEYATAYTLNELEERLDGTRFFRVHQAFIVNLDKVTEISAYGEGSYLLQVGRL